MVRNERPSTTMAQVRTIRPSHMTASPAATGHGTEPEPGSRSGRCAGTR
ncbi:MAG TPA: hypothetical protein VHW06_17295 [Streptosporangiaceae bacterium]|nr:hypothetical protein [Streptosporangiaceae bacterium]